MTKPVWWLSLSLCGPLYKQDRLWNALALSEAAGDALQDQEEDDERDCKWYFPPDASLGIKFGGQMFQLVFDLFAELLGGSLGGRQATYLNIVAGAILFDSEQSLLKCPSGVGLAALWRVEQILTALLPTVSSDTPDGMIAKPIEEAEYLLNFAEKLADRPPFDETGGKLLQNGVGRIGVMLDFVSRARQEPWFGEVREWILDDWMWNNFNQRGRVLLLSPSHLRRGTSKLASAPVDGICEARLRRWCRKAGMMSRGPSRLRSETWSGGRFLVL
eukprot:TRINITY_DN45181_c0_g1_i2.p3 TRINITY_DN45181_c0_g1~~TRINITY_DN45181_c0_g1_i2.p3  ORF type:complete len:274 (+),score=57.83 TRINITY_DN45181_c0_g1_i2:81-902(+)